MINSRWMTVVLVAAGGLLPALVYWLLLGRQPTVTPWQAKGMLGRDATSVVLVDIREPEAFQQAHIDGAVNWPLADLEQAKHVGDLPAAFRGKTLLLVSEVGLASVGAARQLRRAGLHQVYRVRGGIQEWIRSAAGPSGEVYDRWRIDESRVEEFPFRQPTFLHQIAAVAAFFWIKPIYTMLALGAIVFLWNCRAADLVALRWGMISFFLGENACAINVLALGDHSYVLEYLHSFGMAVCLGFTAFAALEGIDRRVLGLSDPSRRCAALALCQRCIKVEEVPCGLRRMFLMIIPLCIALALMLPLADWRNEAYNTLIFGQLFSYGHLRAYQLYENWVCPAAATLLFTASLGVLVLGGDRAVRWAKLFFAAGIGPLGFGLLRMTISRVYGDNQVWYSFWEETTELMFLIGIVCTLWIFHAHLNPGWFLFRPPGRT